MAFTIHLPECMQDTLSQKYGVAVATTEPHHLKRSLSFERDIDQPQCNTSSSHVEKLRAIVCIADQMPPRPVLGVTRDRPRNLLHLFAQDVDVTTVTAETIPSSLMSIANDMTIPRSTIRMEGKGRYRAVSLLDPLKTLCIASDARVARVVITMSMLDEHIPVSHLTNALRQFIQDPRLLKRWLASVDSESITCRV